MPYLLISTQIRLVSTRCPSLGVGFGPWAGGRCRPHLGASFPGHACGCRDAEAAWDTPPAGGGEEGWNSDPAWIQGLGSSGGRALPAAEPLQRREGGLCACVPATQEFRAPAARVLPACGRSKPLRGAQKVLLSQVQQPLPYTEPLRRAMRGGRSGLT